MRRTFLLLAHCLENLNVTMLSLSIKRLDEDPLPARRDDFPNAFNDLTNPASYPLPTGIDRRSTNHDLEY